MPVMENAARKTIIAVLSREFGRPPAVIEDVLRIFGEGGTVPFVARYRKEATRDLDETALRGLEERWKYLNELEERKETVLKTILELGKLTPRLEKQIADCLDKNALEEIYLPYKPKRRTRASMAREKGLGPLADAILAAGPDGQPRDLALALMARFKDVADADEALKGAADIIAEQVADNPDLRAPVREMLSATGKYISGVHKDFKDKPSKFEMYYQFSAPVKNISSHNLLAMRRGEKEGVLSMALEADDAKITMWIQAKAVPHPGSAAGNFIAAAAADGYRRLMRPSLETLVRLDDKERADGDAIENFAANLRKLVLFPPAGSRPVIGLDPGFRTGCKVAVMDATGKYLASIPIYPTEPRNDAAGASQVLAALIKQNNIELISIGNGTASRETEAFVRSFLDSPAGSAFKNRVTVVMVNESGASVYSASVAGVEEFPDLDVTVRGAISIGRRLQDPLAELVKIEPKSLGVGQYQHDVDQNRLEKKLHAVVESCVNQVGVDLNTASSHLLAYVAGLSPRTAQAVTAYRAEHGAFKNRQELLKVSGLGPKAFEQCAGFLRIRQGENPLDNSAVHPERYRIVEKMAKSLGAKVESLVGNPDLASRLKPQDFVDEASGAGLPTIKDILEELAKPGRDPRKEFRTAAFKEGVQEMKDLKPGMILEGNVTNVANFGAFVDIGVHQDGLVHVSELAHKFVTDPHTVISVGDIVKVKVLQMEAGKKRIALSIKALLDKPAASGPRPAPHPHPAARPKAAPPPPKKVSVNDLRARFGGKL
jgi:uncharacterized protein